jgi:LmbE family N-acetylglucosaminyl deacetylase/CheY-like chemotaxis protein
MNNSQRNPHPVVLVVEDDPAIAEFTRAALAASGGYDVVVAGDGRSASARFAEREFDAVVTDVELPDGNGIELARAYKAVSPQTPLVVMTGHQSFEHAVDAVNCGADAFLTKPVSASELVGTVTSLIDRAARAATPHNVVLAIGAHPDDVEIGCGGTLIRHAEEGDSVWVLTLTQGEQGGDAAKRIEESHAACEILGARLLLDDLPDTRVPESGPTIEAIEGAISTVHPTRIYTHSRNDNHQDHRAVHSATLVAARGVANVSCYQAPSTDIAFAPSQFVDITSVIDRKLDAIHAFHSQWAIRGYLEDEMIRATARYWSRFGQGRYVEALEIVRSAGSGVSEAAVRAAA